MRLAFNTMCIIIDRWNHASTSLSRNDADPPDEISKGWIEFLPEVDLFCCEVTRAERG